MYRFIIVMAQIVVKNKNTLENTVFFIVRQKNKFNIARQWLDTLIF